MEIRPDFFDLIYMFKSYSEYNKIIDKRKRIFLSSWGTFFNFKPDVNMWSVSRSSRVWFQYQIQWFAKGISRNKEMNTGKLKTKMYVRDVRESESPTNLANILLDGNFEVWQLMIEINTLMLCKQVLFIYSNSKNFLT